MGQSVVGALQRDRDSNVRVALAHDWLVGMRGGERVLDRLATLFGPTDLYVMVANGESHSPAIDACRVHTSSMQRWPGGAGRLRRWYLPWYPRAVRSLHIPPRFDLLISTSSAMIKAIRSPLHPDHGRPIPHLCYCHSPPRYLWDQRGEYATGGSGTLRRAGLAVFSPSLRRIDRRSSAGVTTFIANSTHTARAIERIYERSAVVIPPPVDTDYFTPDASVVREEFYLVVSALEPYKRIDLAIEAAVRGKRRLIVVGAGSQSERLRSVAGGRVEFTGWIERDRIRDLMRRARALLFPGVEDFGITPVEAMACGCPVIAQNAGGALDWMTPDVGATFEKSTSRDLLDAIERFERNDRVDASMCRANAERFGVERFDRATVEQVERILALRDGDG